MSLSQSACADLKIAIRRVPQSCALFTHKWDHSRECESCQTPPTVIPNGAEEFVCSRSQKSEGANPLASLRPYFSDFSKIWFGSQITIDCHLESVRFPQAEAYDPHHSFPLLQS